MNRIAIFGAAGRIGAPLVRQLVGHAPETKLQLISSKVDQTQSLNASFPTADVCTADYFDVDSLRRALHDVNGVFVITPHFLDEEVAMSNLVSVLEGSDEFQLLVRVVGYHPGSRLADVPQALRDFGSGVATQHFVAQEVLQASGLPATFLNLGASMMDNFLRNTPLRSRGTLVWHPRRIPYVDPRDVAEAASGILLSSKEHLGKVYHLNNNHDLRTGADVASLMGQVAGKPIAYDGSRSAYLEMTAERIRRDFGVEGGAEYLWDFFEYERSIESHWTLNPTLQQLLGRPPTTLAEWIEEHRARLFVA
jgi:uncharacterized protein YbjT (DUF2867 family)